MIYIQNIWRSLITHSRKVNPHKTFDQPMNYFTKMKRKRFNQIFPKEDMKMDSKLMNT